MNPEKLLKAEVAKSTLKVIAEATGCSIGHIHDMANGRRPVSEKALSWLGIERCITYRRIRK